MSIISVHAESVSARNNWNIKKLYSSPGFLLPEINKYENFRNTYLSYNYQKHFLEIFIFLKKSLSFILFLRKKNSFSKPNEDAFFFCLSNARENVHSKIIVSEKNRNRRSKLLLRPRRSKCEESSRKRNLPFSTFYKLH